MIYQTLTHFNPSKVVFWVVFLSWANIKLKFYFFFKVVHEKFIKPKKNRIIPVSFTEIANLTRQKQSGIIIY